MPILQFDYFASEILNIIMLLLLAWLISINKTISKQIELAYYISIFSTVIVFLSEISCDLLSTKGANYRIYSIIANVIGFSVSATIPISMAMIFDVMISKKTKLAMAFPVIINFVLVILSPFYGYIFSVSPENIYFRGPLFFIYGITYSLNILILIKVIYNSAMHSNVYEKQFLFAIFFLTVIGTSIQVIFPLIHTTWQCVSIVLVLYYIFLCEMRFKYDAITKVFNRQTFDRAISDLKQSKAALIIVIDIDNFKKINDTYGHLHGDYCLKVVASAISRSFEKEGNCYRIGGDEFCVICHKVDLEKINSCISRIIKEISDLRKSDSSIPFVSYGYSMYENDGTRSIQEAIDLADKNMYEFKKMKK